MAKKNWHDKSVHISSGLNTNIFFYKYTNKIGLVIVLGLDVFDQNKVMTPKTVSPTRIHFKNC